MGHGLTFTDSPTIEPTIANRLRTVCGGVGIVGLIASAGLAFSTEDGMKQFYFSREKLHINFTHDQKKYDPPPVLKTGLPFGFFSLQEEK